jgi:DNA-binding PadR family transcriptional regulator
MNNIPEPSFHSLQLEPLSAIELYSLIALGNAEIHPYELAKCIRLDSEDRLDVTPAGIKLALKRMALKGWVERTDSPGRQQRYHLTDWGRFQLGSELDRLESAAMLGRHRLRLAEHLLS